MSSDGPCMAVHASPLAPSSGPVKPGSRGSKQNHVAANRASKLICRAVPGAACGGVNVAYRLYSVDELN